MRIPLYDLYIAGDTKFGLQMFKTHWVRSKTAIYALLNPIYNGKPLKKRKFEVYVPKTTGDFFYDPYDHAHEVWGKSDQNWLQTNLLLSASRAWDGKKTAKQRKMPLKNGKLNFRSQKTWAIFFTAHRIMLTKFGVNRIKTRFKRTFLAKNGSQTVKRP